MAYTGRFGQSEDFRREELIRKIEHSVESLTLQELEALYYDMSTKNCLNTSFPWGTFTVNVLGSLLIGLLVGFVSKGVLPPEMKLLLVTGFCGGFSD